MMTDLGSGYWDDAPSGVPGFTNKQLREALEKSKKENPDSTFGASPSVDYGFGVNPSPPGGSEKEQPLLAINWKSWLEDWGFPSEVVNKLDSMARQYTPAQAELFARDAIMYLRGTDWHKQTFAGFAEGYKSGLFTDERQYRAYVQNANDLYQRFYKRNISTDELVSTFSKGYNPQRLANELEAVAYANANRNELQYLSGNFGEGRLDEEGLLSIGRQQAGISNALGTDLLNRVGQAQSRLRRIFEGTLATGTLRGTSVATGTNLSDIGR